MKQTDREQIPEACSWEGTDDDDVCEREPTEDGFCVVHSPTQNQSPERFCQCIEDEYSLGGLKSTQLNLENKTIELDDNEAINISDADIRTLCLDGAVITNEIKIENARVERFSAKNAVFERGLSLQNVDCHEFVADGARIEGPLRVNDTKIEEDLSVEDGRIDRLEGNSGTTVGALRLSDSAISGELILEKTTIRNGAYLSRVSLGERCSLIGSEFKSGIMIDNSVVNGQFEMYDSVVQGEAIFKNTEFNSGLADFTGGSFEKVIFDSVSSDNRLVFGSLAKDKEREPAEIKSEARFAGVSTEELNLTGVNIRANLKMTGLSSGRLDLSRASCDSVDLRRSSVERELSFQDANVGSLDLRDSHFRGSVDFADTTIEGTLASQAVAYVESVTWKDLKVGGVANFDQASFGSGVDFTGAEFERFTDFCGARFEEVAVFDDTEFETGVRFDRLNQANLVPSATFESDVSFLDAEISGVIFSGCSFHGDVNLDRADFEGTVVDLHEAREEVAQQFRRTNNSGASKDPRTNPFDESTGRPVSRGDYTSAGRSLQDHFVLRPDQDEIGKNSGGRPDEAEESQEKYRDDGRSISVSFHGANLTGNLSLGNVEVGETLDLTLATVDGDVAVNGSIHGLRLNRARIEGTFNLSEVEVRGPIYSEDATYHGDVRWERGVVTEQSNFSRCRFESEASFESTDFGGLVTFSGVRFGGVAKFSEANFEQGVRFNRFDNSAEETNGMSPTPPATFESDAYFTNTIFHGANFADCLFSGSSNFDEATFKRERTEKESNISNYGSNDNNTNRVSRRVVSDEYGYKNSNQVPENKIVGIFRNAKFSDFASFDGVELCGHINFEGVMYAKVNIRLAARRSESDATVGDVPIVSLRRSRITEGNLFVLNDDNQKIKLDLTEARLNDVVIRPRDQVNNVLGQCKIDRTEFDGFNFTPYASSLRRRRWTIHSTEENIPRMGLLGRKRYALSLAFHDYVDIFRGDGDADEYRRLRTTYQYAKQGASQSGQNEAASKLFQREMEYQSRQLACERSILKLLSTLGFGFTSRYGESGMRVGFVALLIILIYTPVYRTLSDVGNTWSESLTLSFGAFSTILVGATDGTVSSVTNLAAATQGFIGALLIALLLFTLTRSIHR